MIKILEQTPSISDFSGRTRGLLLLLLERFFSNLRSRLRREGDETRPQKMFDFVLLNKTFYTVKHHIKDVLRPHWRSPQTAEQMLLKLLWHCCYLDCNGLALDSFLIELVLSWLNVNNDRLLFWSCLRLVGDYEKFNFFSRLGLTLLAQCAKIPFKKLFSKPWLLLLVIILRVVMLPKIETALSLINPPVFSISEFANNLEDINKIKRLTEIVRRIEEVWGMDTLQRIREFRFKIKRALAQCAEYAMFYEEVFKQNYSFIMEMMMNSLLVQNGLIYLFKNRQSTRR